MLSLPNFMALQEPTIRWLPLLMTFLGDHTTIVGGGRGQYASRYTLKQFKQFSVIVPRSHSVTHNEATGALQSNVVVKDNIYPCRVRHLSSTAPPGARAPASLPLFLPFCLRRQKTPCEACREAPVCVAAGAIRESLATFLASSPWRFTFCTISTRRPGRRPP